MRSQHFGFPGATGATLAARLDLPVDESPIAYALFAHCFTCSKDLKAAGDLARALNQERIAVLRFDFTGLGESGGEFADTSFSSNVGDLVAAARHMESNLRAPALLIGHSLGGAAVIRAAGRIPSARAIVTIGAPADPEHVKRHIAASVEEIEAEGSAEVEIEGRRFRIGKQFLQDLEEAGMRHAIRNLDRALLILHSPIDRVVGIENAARIYEAARHPKSFISLDTADHLLTDGRDSRYAARVLAAWASRYLEAPPPPTADQLARDGRVAVRTGRARFRTEILANGYGLVADEPASLGGTDLGPTPYDLLVAALGACTSITLRMYADRKGWPLEEAIVRLRHGKVHGVDTDRCEDAEARVDQVERELELKGTLTEEQRARLLEVAGHCPVHRTLERGVVVKTSLQGS